MNATRRTSLVAFLAIIPLAVMTGCGTATPGTANPAATASSTSASATASTTAPPSASEPSSQEPASQENSETPSQEPTSEESTSPKSTSHEPTSHEPTSHEPTSHEPTSQVPTSDDPETNGPDVRPTDLSGEVYGFIRAVDLARSEITLDKVDWFAGTDAEQACRVDNVPPEEILNGWCSIYYFRNVNPKLRVVSVSTDAAITNLHGNIPVSGDLQELADRAAVPGGDYHLYRMTVNDGAIVDLTQIYQP